MRFFCSSGLTDCTPAKKLHIFHHGQVRGQGKLLGDIADTGADLIHITHGIEAKHAAFAAGTGEQAQDEPCGGGFPGAIRADQADRYRRGLPATKESTAVTTFLRVLNSFTRSWLRWQIDPFYFTFIQSSRILNLLDDNKDNDQGIEHQDQGIAPDEFKPTPFK